MSQWPSINSVLAITQNLEWPRNVPNVPLPDHLASRAANLVQEAGAFTRRIALEVADKTKEVGVPGHFYDSADEKLRDVRKLLDSKFEREVLDGLRLLLALICKGKDVAEYFPDVVRNVASTSFEVRKLVYIYLIRYAEQEPDLALLSINTFQKDLSDMNPVIRAMSLRVLSSIRVAVIVPIVMFALKKATTDMSPYVRKTAANAIPKVDSLDPTQRPHLLELIETMLNDNSSAVLGSVIASFNALCPDRLDMIHKHYRKLCRTLADADEWGQVEVLAILLRYARAQFLDPKANETTTSTTTAQQPNSFYDDDTTTSSVSLDPDHLLLLDSLQPLLNSRNPMVVLSVARLLFHAAPSSHLRAAVAPLVRLIRSGAREERYVVLMNVYTILESGGEAVRKAWAPHVLCFFVFAGEPGFVVDLKLELLALVASEDNFTVVLNEMKNYVRSADEKLVVRTVRAVGRLCGRFPVLVDEALDVLMGLLGTKNDSVIAESIVVIRRLVQQLCVQPGPASTSQTTPDASRTTAVRIIVQLSNSLDTITSPSARAAILWLLGQYASYVPRTAPDALRRVARTFTTESDAVKLATLSMGSKLAVERVSKIQDDHTDDEHARTRSVLLLLAYVVEMARFDLNYDVRDRARMLKALVLDVLVRRVEGTPAHPKHDSNSPIAASAPTSANGDEKDAVLPLLSQHLASIFLAPRSVPIDPSPYSGRQEYTLSSLSHLLNRVSGPSYQPLPDWPTEKPDSSVRQVEEKESWNRERVVAAPEREIRKTKKTKTRMVTLDEFYKDVSTASSTTPAVPEEQPPPPTPPRPAAAAATVASPSTLPPSPSRNGALLAGWGSLSAAVADAASVEYEEVDDDEDMVDDDDDEDGEDDDDMDMDDVDEDDEDDD
ncbi:adaptin N terminal region-domain-containing protein [Cladochytrium replicatum]|nr:adaptin N terminal region-domain-containing protein [Cladochytrium replicatum]